MPPQAHQPDTRRDLVLRLLRSSPDPVGVADLAERLAVHPNTVRFHLAALETDGLVERAETVVAGRGRPPITYRARPGVHHTRTDVLAEILLDSLGGGPEAHERAAAAGQAWGQRHAEHTSGDGSPIARLVGYLDEIGFAPQTTDAGTIDLHNCPFHDSVRTRGEVVCALHAGLITGALIGWDATPTGTTLQPFIRPGVCRVRLEPTGAAA